MNLSPNDCSSPTPITPAHVLMRIIHQLFVPHILWAPQFPTLHRKHKKQRRNLIYSHEKPTVYIDTNPALQTFSPSLDSTKYLQMAPGSWSLVLKQWEEMWCLKKRVHQQLENNGQHAQWVLFAMFLTDYIFISWKIFRVSWEQLQRQPLTLSTLTLTFPINRRASSSHCSLYSCLSSQPSPATAAS